MKVPPSDVSKVTAGQKGTTYQILDTNQDTAQINAQAQEEQFQEIERKRPVIIPRSDLSLETFEEKMFGIRPQTTPRPRVKHTNYLLLATDAATQPEGQTPASLRRIYNVAPNAGSNAIAIVDAFHYRTAEADLNTFSRQFSLQELKNCDTPGADPKHCLKIIFQNNKVPREQCDWAGESALDLQWAHAMAPNAKLIFIEAQSNNDPDLYAAVKLAMAELIKSGGGELSLSWGGIEGPDDKDNDVAFNQPGVTVFASSGDVGGKVIYPSSSPNVVSVGGSSLVFSSGTFVGEEGWDGSGGGPSAFEGKPAYQNGVPHTDARKRSTPDVAAVADPETGASVYDSVQCGGRSGWVVIGGTSLAAPLVAGIVNAAGHFKGSSVAELKAIYPNRAVPTRFRDIVKGIAGGFSAGPGYDFVTGIGAPLGLEFDLP